MCIVCNSLYVNLQMAAPAAQRRTTMTSQRRRPPPICRRPARDSTCWKSICHPWGRGSGSSFRGGGVLALRWWFKRREAKGVWRQELFEGNSGFLPQHNAFPMMYYHPSFAPPWFWMDMEAGWFEELPPGAAAADPCPSRPSPSRHPVSCHLGRCLVLPSSHTLEDEGSDHGPALGSC